MNLNQIKNSSIQFKQLIDFKSISGQNYSISKMNENQNLVNEDLSFNELKNENLEIIFPKKLFLNGNFQKNTEKALSSTQLILNTDSDDYFSSNESMSNFEFNFSLLKEKTQNHQMLTSPRVFYSQEKHMKNTLKYQFTNPKKVKRIQKTKSRKNTIRIQLFKKKNILNRNKVNSKGMNKNVFDSLLLNEFFKQIRIEKEKIVNSQEPEYPSKLPGIYFPVFKSKKIHTLFSEIHLKGSNLPQNSLNLKKKSYTNSSKYINSPFNELLLEEDDNLFQN
jgi:hypothetical protein